MKLVRAFAPDPQHPERLGIVVEPHPNAPNRAFAQLAEGSDWHEMTSFGALLGGVFPTRKGQGQKLEHLALAWKLGRDAARTMSHQPRVSTPRPAPAPPSSASPTAQASLLTMLGAMLAQAAGGSLVAEPAGGSLQAEATDPFAALGAAVAVDFESLSGWDSRDSAPPQLPAPAPAPEPKVDGAEVQKDCDEFDQSLAALNAHLDEARYRAGGL